MSSAESQTIRLRDGRDLAFAEYGDPEGMPLIGIHGTPGSRLVFRLSDEPAKNLRVRVIAPDRPGYGLSSPHKRRTLADWAADVDELADRLQLPSYAVIGVSGGGPHAVACAAYNQERVSSLGLVCPLGPVANQEFDDTVTLGYRIFFKYLARVPGAMRGIFTVGRFGFFYLPVLIYGAVLARATPDDWRILMRKEVRRSITTAMREGFRPSLRGGLGDVDVFCRPWDFSVEDIKVPTNLWQGLSDRNVPVKTSLRLGEKMPNCTVHQIPRSGHYWIFDNIETVLKTVASR